MNKNALLCDFISGILAQLKSGNSLKSSVKILMEQKNASGKLVKLCQHVFNGLNEGEKLSSVLNGFSSKIPVWFSSFVYVAEEGCCLEKILDFSLQILKAKIKTKRKILEESAYPAFVVFLALCSSFAAAMFFPMNMEMKNNFFKSMFFAAVFLLSSFAFLFLLSCHFFKTDKILLFFKSMAFLKESSIPLLQSVDCSWEITGGEKKLEETVVNIHHRLLWGENAQSVFEEEFEKIGVKICGQMNSSVFFEDMACIREEKNRRIQKVILDYQQPVMICLVAVYLIVLLKNIIVPLLQGGIF